jgi:hypothetical protein
MGTGLDKFLTLLTYLLLSSSPIVGVYVFASTKNAGQAFALAITFFCLGLGLSFSTQIWNKLMETWVPDTASSVDTVMRNLFSRFKHRYSLFLNARHRDFDVKGLDTQGIYNLELNQVFVDLAIIPKSSFETSIVPSRNAVQQLKQGGNPIWKYLQGPTPHKLTIIGPPGSGKTTLVKHIALVLVGSRKIRQKLGAPNKLPVILFLREQYKNILKNAEMSLSEVIELSLAKYKLTSPPGWFESRLKKGRLIIMLDGLDEVADPDSRKQVVSWVERQMVIYDNNDYIITSRPLGYKENQLSGVTLLEVVPFNINQVQTFIRNWYTANEIRASDKNDFGAKINAEEGSDSLIRRLRKTPVLLELAVNPLLLTMITTVHRYRGSLPERRVELYEEICKVFLGKRQQAKELQLELSPSQSQLVLEPLAYAMMKRHQLEINVKDLASEIEPFLALISFDGDAVRFINWIESSSGLMLERGTGIYGFCHKTFQEFLAAAYIHKKGLAEELVGKITDVWWDESIRLYCAQADATPIVSACLNKVPLETKTLALAIQCTQESLSIEKCVRSQLENILMQDLEHKDAERRHVVADALLALRSYRMERLTETTYFDPSPITNAEYQLFLDDLRLIGEYCQPLHWLDTSFSPRKGPEPVCGISAANAARFCRWLTTRDKSGWQYRLPADDEILLYGIALDNCFWSILNTQQNKPHIYHPRPDTALVSTQFLHEQITIDTNARNAKPFSVLNIDAPVLLDNDLILGFLKKEDVNSAKIRLEELSKDSPLFLDFESYYDYKLPLTLSRNVFMKVADEINHLYERASFLLSNIEAGSHSIKDKKGYEYLQLPQGTRKINELLDGESSTLNRQIPVELVLNKATEIQMQLATVLSDLKKVKSMLQHISPSQDDESRWSLIHGLDYQKAVDLDRSLENARAWQLYSSNKWGMFTNNRNQEWVLKLILGLQAIHRGASILISSADKKILSFIKDFENVEQEIAGIQNRIHQSFMLMLPFFLLPSKTLRDALQDISNRGMKTKNTDVILNVRLLTLSCALSLISFDPVSNSIEEQNRDNTDRSHLIDYFLGIYILTTVLDKQIQGELSPLDNLYIIKYH